MEIRPGCGEVKGRGRGGKGRNMGEVRDGTWGGKGWGMGRYGEGNVEVRGRSLRREGKERRGAKEGCSPYLKNI